MFHPEPDRPASPAFATPSFAQPVAAREGILYGPLGLRAGWGIALYMLTAIVLMLVFFFGSFKLTGQAARANAERHQRQQAKAAAVARHQPLPAPPLGLVDSGLAEFSEAAGVVLAAVLLAVLERRSFRSYGLPKRHLRDLLPGALTGLVAIGVLVGTLRVLHLLAFDARLLHGSALVRYALGWLLVFSLVGLFEEFLFRGYLQFTLMRGVLRLGQRISPAHARLAAFWTAALAWSLLFGATHLGNTGEDAMGIVMVFAAGLLFSFALWKTGSLWWGIGFHATWDWGQSFLFGVPDSGHLSVGRLFQTHPMGAVLLSGGSAGPEGSLLVLPVLMAVGLVLWRRPQAAQPPLEPFAVPLHRAGNEVVPVP